MKYWKKFGAFYQAAGYLGSPKWYEYQPHSIWVCVDEIVQPSIRHC